MREAIGVLPSTTYKQFPDELPEEDGYWLECEDFSKLRPRFSLGWEENRDVWVDGFIGFVRDNGHQHSTYTKDQLERFPNEFLIGKLHSIFSNIIAARKHTKLTEAEKAEAARKARHVARRNTVSISSKPTTPQCSHSLLYPESCGASRDS